MVMKTIGCFISRIFKSEQPFSPNKTQWNNLFIDISSWKENCCLLEWAQPDSKTNSDESQVGIRNRFFFTGYSEIYLPIKLNKDFFYSCLKKFILYTFLWASKPKNDFRIVDINITNYHISEFTTSISTTYNISWTLLLLHQYFQDENWDDDSYSIDFYSHKMILLFQKGTQRQMVSIL